MNSLTLTPALPRERHALRWALRACLVALAYYLTGRVGLAFPYVGSHITLIWAPAGIALAALLRWGPGMAAAIVVAALGVNLSVGASLPLAVAMAAGNTIGPLAATLLLRRLGFHNELDRRDDVLLYALLAGAGLALTASVGVLAMSLTDALAWSEAARAWGFWWLGDVVGALVAGVPLLTLSWHTLQHDKTLGKATGTLALSAFTVASGAAALLTPAGAAGLSPLIFVPHLLLAWLAVRAGVCIASSTALLLAGCAVWGMSQGLGPFYTGNASQGLALLWGYMLSLSVVAVLLTA